MELSTPASCQDRLDERQAIARLRLATAATPAIRPTTEMATILRKLGVRDRTQAVVVALSHSSD